MKYIEGIRTALYEILRVDKKAILIGEDIKDPYGGAFKVTKNLSTAFPDQVLQTPISEAGFVGVATGLAMGGFRPIVEIMFGDFVTLITDIVINSASKFSWLSQGDLNINLIIRTPMGGRRGYGPIHSQSLEKLYLGWPNVNIISPNIVSDPHKLLLDTFYKKEGVTFLIENKTDYPQDIADETEFRNKDFKFSRFGEDFPTIVVSNFSSNEQPDITICCYGGMVRFALQAAFELLIEDEITSHICVPSSIYPVQIDHITECIKETRNLVVVEEAYAQAGWSSYIVTELIQSENLKISLSDISIVGTDMIPIPASVEWENEHLPGADNIKEAVKNILCRK